MGKYYNVRDALRRNAVITVVCGGRGIGKSFSAKRVLIDEWVRRGAQSMYVRRYMDDLRIFKTFFNDIAEFYPDYEFKIDGLSGYGRLRGDEKWDLILTATSLSTSHKLKSGSFKEVRFILFDEFIAAPNSRYLTNEVDTLYELYSTVDRYEDRVRVVMLANAVSIDNPYFNRWGLNSGVEWQKYGGGFVVCHLPRAEAFTESVRRTRFGAFVLNHEPTYAAYSIDNQFIDNTSAFIGDKPAGSRPAFAVRTPEVELTVWIMPDAGGYCVTTGLNGDQRYAVDCTPRVGEQPMARNSELVRAMRTKWYNGQLLFASLPARNAFRKLL